MVLVSQPANAALWEKRYPVKTFGDQRILCDPYQVKPGDWLHKIFLSRGELAEYDFKTFSRIFKHLNPHVTHINRINSGDWIFIPLKRLSTETPVDASSGDLAIPFSSLKDRPVSTHTVVAGDRISELLMKRCGPLNSAAYQTCMALLRQLNPHITNFDRVYPGQTLKLPGLFKKTGMGKPNSPKKTRNRATRTLAKPLFPENLNTELLQRASRLAKLLQARFKGRGKYHFPQTNGGVTRVDLEKSPLLQFKNSDRFLLMPPDLLSKIDSGAVQGHWPNATLVPLTLPTPDFYHLLDDLTAKLDPAHYRTSLTVMVPGGQVTINAPWLIAPNNKRQDGLLFVPQGRILDLGILQQIETFCSNAGVLLREISEKGESTRPPRSLKSNATFALLEIKPAPIKERLKQLALGLGLRYRGNVTLKFPYGGVFVETMADALENPSGQLCIVDNGQFAGQSIDAIKQTGLEVISIQPGESLYERLPELLTKLQIPYTMNPEMTVLNTPHLEVRLKLDGLFLTRAEATAPILVTTSSPDKKLQPLLTAMQMKVLILTPNQKDNEL